MTSIQSIGKFCVALVLSVTVAAAPADQLPAQAYIKAGEHGQALLLSRLGECYAITPEHVIEGELFATLTGGDSGKSQGDGDLLQTFGYDLSILRVSGGLRDKCGGALGAISTLDDLFANVSSASVSSRNADGSITRRNVSLNDVGLIYLRVRPVTDDDQLFKGLSGSLVLVNDRPAGILMSVDPETGEGRALRYDRAGEILRPFFGLAARQPAAATPGPAGDGQGAGGAAVEVTSWSSPPLNAASRAANLTAGDNPWYARAGDFPVEVVLRLEGDKALALGSIRLVAGGVDPRQRLLRDFEILTSSTLDDDWISVATGTFFQNDEDKRVAFAPMYARQIMLRIYSHWGDPDAVGLGSIEPGLQ